MLLTSTASIGRVTTTTAVIFRKAYLETFGFCKTKHKHPTFKFKGVFKSAAKRCEAFYTLYAAAL